MKARSMTKTAKLKRAFLILRLSVKALEKANKKNKDIRIKVGMAKPYFAIMSLTSSLIADAISVMMLRSTSIPETLKI
jgi:hypothetical protein